MTTLLFSRRLPLDHLFPLWLGPLSLFSILWFQLGARGQFSFWGWVLLAVGWLGVTSALLEPEEALVQDEPIAGQWIRRLFPLALPLLGAAFAFSLWSRQAPVQLLVLVAFVVVSWLRAWSPQLRWTKRGLWKLGRNPSYVPTEELTILEAQHQQLRWQSALGPQWEWEFSSSEVLDSWQEVLPATGQDISRPPPPATAEKPLPSFPSSPIRWLVFLGLLGTFGFWANQSGKASSAHWSFWFWGTLCCLALSRLSLKPWWYLRWKRPRWSALHRDSAWNYWRRIALPMAVLALLLALSQGLFVWGRLSWETLLFWSLPALLVVMDVSGTQAWVVWEGQDLWVRILPWGERIHLSSVDNIQPTDNGQLCFVKTEKNVWWVCWEKEREEEFLRLWREQDEEEIQETASS